MSSYIVRVADTFERISRRMFGTADNAGMIRAANPGVFLPLIPGTVLVIPDQPPAPPAQRPQGEDVALLIDGQRFRFWSEITINRSLDQVSTVEFRAPFDPAQPRQRETFRPFTFKPVSVLFAGVPLFAGTMVGVTPDLQTASRTLSVSCYGTPAVLNDCTMPASAFPLSFSNADIKVIAERLLMPFGLTAEFTAPPGAVFRLVRCDPQRKVLDFLIDLAKQRNLVISDNAAGGLLFSSVSSGSAQPAATLEEGSSPVTSITPTFNAQGYYSHITGIAPIALGRIGSQFTVQNERLTGVIRPLIFNAKDSVNANIPQATENKLSRMFGNVAAYAVSVDTWLDQSGQIWQPNTMIRITAPGAMIYRPSAMLIRSVTYQQTARSRTAVLNLVLPGSFGGVMPEVLPWDS